LHGLFQRRKRFGWRRFGVFRQAPGVFDGGQKGSHPLPISCEDRAAVVAFRNLKNVEIKSIVKVQVDFRKNHTPRISAAESKQQRLEDSNGPTHKRKDKFEFSKSV